MPERKGRFVVEAADSPLTSGEKAVSQRSADCKPMPIRKGRFVVSEVEEEDGDDDAGAAVQLPRQHQHQRQHQQRQQAAQMAHMQLRQQSAPPTAPQPQRAPQPAVGHAVGHAGPRRTNAAPIRKGRFLVTEADDDDDDGASVASDAQSQSGYGSEASFNTVPGIVSAEQMNRHNLSLAMQAPPGGIGASQAAVGGCGAAIRGTVAAVGGERSRI